MLDGQELRFRDNSSLCLTSMLVEDCILEVVHWYGFYILGQDITRF